MGFYRGGKVTCAGPDGPAIEMREVARDDLRSELSKVLHRLVTEGDLEASDVVVLTPHAADHSPVAGQVGSFNLMDQGKSLSGGWPRSRTQCQYLGLRFPRWRPR
jgi:hypothetical protein